MLSFALNPAFVMAGVLATALTGLLPGSAIPGFLLARWTGMGPAEWSASLIGRIGAAFAYQNGPLAMIGAFDFGWAGCAVIWGWSSLHKVPDAISTLGMALIVGAGILSLRQ